MSSITTTNLLSQSKYLYLQSAGSDGSDGSASGIHLRWDLLGTLGDNHIPKGNLAASGTYYTNAKYNKADDFVKIYKTPYDRTFPIVINFANTAPQVVESQTEKIWKYNNVVPTNLTTTRNVIIRFPDCYQYNLAKNTYDPSNVDNVVNFLKSYNGIIEVEVEDQRIFAAYVYMAEIDPTKVNITRLESVSLDETSSDTSSLFVSGRKKYTIEEGYLAKEDTDLVLKEDDYNIELDQLGGGSRKLMAENIKYIRFLGDNCYPTTLWLETYEDFLLGKNNNSEWTHVTDRALSLDEDEVYTRLEDRDNYNIDNLWPRYTDNYKVDVNNYKTRWIDTIDTDSSTIDGLNTAVKEYLTLSMDPNNLEANNTSAYEESTTEYVSDDKDAFENDSDGEDLTDDIVPTADEGANADAKTQECEMSYLNMLKLVAFDFHIARMLGLGHIDTSVSDAKKYIYIAVYDTNDSIDSYTAALRHTYMALPTGKTDYKLPYAPQQADVSYGLRVSCGDNDTKLITDENGYSSYGTSRAINLNLTYSGAPYPLDYFFKPDEEYSFAEYTQPIMYGIKYKKTSASSWNELCFDTDFTDQNNNNEVMPVMSTGKNPIYTHLETDTGVHDYAVYGINWFSRVSSLSSPESTNDTEFTHTYTLMPPQNFAAQFIQTEKILVLTTDKEQQRLSGLGADTTLVRVTFDWDNVNYANYWYGQQAQFYFRTEGVNVVAGMIKSVTSAGTNLYEVRTTSYNLTSQDLDATTNTVNTVTPSITSGTESHYEKSLFTSNGVQYQVQSVSQSTVSGEGPVFILQGLNETTLIDPDNDGVFTLVKKVTEPKAAYAFSVSENTTLAECWTKQLSQTVTLTKFSDHTEIKKYEDGTSSTTYVGGIYQKATIGEYKDMETVNGVEVEIANSITGIYKLTFSGDPLGSPDNKDMVEYYKGVVRIQAADDASNIKQLKVVEITTDDTKTNLVLKVVDPSFALVEGTYTPDSTYSPIPTGSNIDVNFHPGYRAYLVAESGFNQDVIMPATGEGKKYSYMACRAIDGTKAQSYLSATVPMVAREIITPVAPLAPSGADYATRPNFFGKATYTFDVKKGGSRDPYMLIFYRATDQIILDTLYTPDRVTEIKTALASNIYTMDIWKAFISMSLMDDGQFKKIDSTGHSTSSGYGFPNPNQYPFDGRTPGSSSDYFNAIRKAVLAAFIPITEQPILYQFLKWGDQTSPKKPVIFDINGNYLLPGSATYDQAPMAVRHNNGTEVVTRFTDYTIDGASTAMYFYYGVEMGNTMEVSDPSPISGPIKLMNTSAPQVPEIRNFHTQVEDATAGTVTAVVFEINDYLKGDNVTEIQIYRALTNAKAQDIRTMTALDPIQVGYPIIDTFADYNGNPPYGDTLYYRLVAIRKVPYAIVTGTNEVTGKEDTVMSYPSDLMLANILDVNNPTSPTLALSDSTVVTTDLYTNAVLTWTQTVYNGTYYIYQRNSSGTWTKLGEIKSTPTNPATTLTYSLGNLSRVNDGSPIYYSFKATVVNSSGLISLDENILTI
ncbi:MAG: hypothetical protein P4L28_11980 [Paludibacteraceae bacterium]|nr:hypothetical protein [Paludibacteraceae bacterium]